MDNWTTRLGRYELVQPLGRGGMADIYLARELDAAGRAVRVVALKVLNAERAVDAECCALFRDEARMTSLLDHRHVAQVIEVGERDGVQFLAMEYIHGADLRDVMARAVRTKQAIPYETALTIIAAAAAGLDHAHRRCDADGRPLHVVHRDVSLTNIMVGHDGAVKVVDFGIASATISSAGVPTGTVRGKSSYMSPEQVHGDSLDHRSDVFSLGIVLYELTCGTRCFVGDSDVETMLAVARGSYRAPASVVPGYPPELAAVIAKALSVNPAHRYGSAAALIRALEEVAIGRGWVGGPGAIVRLMRRIYGDVPAPALSEPRRAMHALTRPRAAELTRPTTVLRARRAAAVAAVQLAA